VCAELRRIWQDRRGATALEFAIVAPILILMLMAGIQFGMAQNSAGAMSYALEKGARQLLLQPTMSASELETVVDGHLSADQAAKVDVDPDIAVGAGGGNVATITGVYTDQIGLPSLAAVPFNVTRVVVTPLR
jgi:Flp pilus assembly protein TadG